MRKLASIQKIVSVEEIPGANTVVKVKVLGWELVAKRSDFKTGDLCVFFETDSLLPKENPVFAFMANRKYRVKTVKMAGQVSQGLALPLSLFPDVESLGLTEGADLTDRLGIVKYEKEETDPETVISNKKDSKILKFLLKYKIMRTLILPFLSKEKGGFPSDIISKSDETRIQCMPGILQTEADSKFIASEKIEGSSATFSISRIGLFGTSFKVCSRNMKLSRSQNVWWQMYDAYQIRAYLKGILSLLGKSVKSVAIQGEIIGPKICNNIYCLKEPDLYVYRVKINYRDGSVSFFNPYKMRELFDGVQAKFGIKVELKVVPVIWDGWLTQFPDVNSILEFADGFSKLKPDQLREGLVFSKINDPNVSFKTVSRKYLLQKGKKEDAD